MQVPTKCKFLEKVILQYSVTFKKRAILTNIFTIKEKKMTNSNHCYLYMDTQKIALIAPNLKYKNYFFNFEAILIGNIFKISHVNRVYKPNTITKLQSEIEFENFSLFSYRILKENCIMWVRNLYFVILIKHFLKIF